MKRVYSQLFALLLLAGSFSALFAPLASAATYPPGLHSKLSPAFGSWPVSIASTGDSITRAFNTGTTPFTDAPANSWSTGTNAAVNSHYSRILAANPGIAGHNYNDAVTGARMVDLNSQMATVNSQYVDYVTVLLGANDACTATEAAMTPIATYRAQFQAALNTLSASSPDARVYVLSVPNIYNLWSILHDDANARSIWSLFSICQSMLANPQSTAQPDVDRRGRVLQRVVDYNTQLAEVCATNIHCRFDDNAVFNTAFVPSDVSTRDYFHPTLSGQAKIAAASYDVGFDFSDATPPVSHATHYMLPWPNPRVILTADDNIGVAGIEYRIDKGPYTLYTGGEISVNLGSALTYRAVDVNGNVEVAHSIGF